MTTQSVKPRQGSTQTQPEPYGPIVLRLDPVVQLTDDQLAELSSLNDTLRIERNAQGELEILPPAFGITGNQELERNGADLLVWAEGRRQWRQPSTPTAGFTLPNSSVRSPDASWVLKSRRPTKRSAAWRNRMTEEQKQSILRTAASPDLPRLRNRIALPLRFLGRGPPQDGRVY